MAEKQALREDLFNRNLFPQPVLLGLPGGDGLTDTEQDTQFTLQLRYGPLEPIVHTFSIAHTGVMTHALGPAVNLSPARGFSGYGQAEQSREVISGKTTHQTPPLAPLPSPSQFTVFLLVEQF